MTTDRLEFQIMFRSDPLPKAHDLLALLQRDAGELTVSKKAGRQPLDLDRLDIDHDLVFGGSAGESYNFVSYEGDRDPGGRLVMRFPFDRVAGEGRRFASLVEGVCRIAPPLYGWGHSMDDVAQAKEPLRKDPWAKPSVNRAYWLTIFGAPLVKQLGKSHVAATPAHSITWLPDGAVIIVTSPDPGTSLEPAAREAQARALAHLAPELTREWLPASEAPPSDVDDPAAAIRKYVDGAEDFISGFHDQIEGLDEQAPAVLAAIDAHFLEKNYGREHSLRKLEQMFLSTLGAYLGRMMVNSLGGRWVPRRELRETQVVIGDRAWLPFLRVQRFLHAADMRSHSLAAFFAEAQQHR